MPSLVVILRAKLSGGIIVLLSMDNCSPNILEGLWLRGWGLEIVGCGILNTKERNLSHKDQT